MTFWPLERWERAVTFSKNSDADLVVIADHSLSSWWYAIPSSGGVETPVFIVDGLRPSRVVAPSFSAFAEAVFNDDRSIYPPSGAGNSRSQGTAVTTSSMPCGPFIGGFMRTTPGLLLANMVLQRTISH